MGKGIIMRRGLDAKTVNISSVSFSFGNIVLTLESAPSSVSALTLHLLGTTSVMMNSGGTSYNDNYPGLLLVEKTASNSCRIRIFRLQENQYGNVIGISQISSYYASFVLSGNNLTLTPTTTLWSCYMATGWTNYNNQYPADAYGYIVE